MQANNKVHIKPSHLACYFLFLTPTPSAALPPDDSAVTPLVGWAPSEGREGGGEGGSEGEGKERRKKIHTFPYYAITSSPLVDVGFSAFSCGFFPSPSSTSFPREQQRRHSSIVHTVNCREGEGGGEKRRGDEREERERREGRKEKERGEVGRGGRKEEGEGGSK